MDPSTPLEPPPPAYDAEHDYDRKISDALQRSLNISSNQVQQSTTAIDGEEEWEEWDEARFEAAAIAARAHDHGGGSDEQQRPPISRHLSEKERLARQDECHADQNSGEASSSTSPPHPVHPSNVSRRLPNSPPAKERPSWFVEAELDTPASGSSQTIQAPTAPQAHHIPPEEEDPDEPLPPFVAVGPSLEGPPFEEVMRQHPRLPPADSPPQSPLGSVEDSDSLPEPPPFAPHSGRRSYGSTSPRQAAAPPILRPPPLPISSSRPPPMRFDPSVAYTTKQRNLGSLATETESKEPVDASSFYNSSVSSLLGSSQQPQVPKKNITMNRDTLPSTGVYRSSVHDPYHTAPPAPPAPPLHYEAPAPNSYYPVQDHTYIPNQFPPYSQPQPQPAQPAAQLLAPAFYGPPFQGAVPNQPQWPPPHNTYGGGYGR